VIWKDLHDVPANEFGRKTVVVVATIQSFRVTNKAGRRVYAMSEAWEPHFKALNITPAQAKERGLGLVEQADIDEPSQTFLKQADLGRVKYSLANWLAWWQPLVLVDEAHNAKTALSLAMLQAIQPSAVLDLTATPVPKKTNVLYSVSARELEAEDMIKLPIMLAEHETAWQDAVRDALLRRTQLEAEAVHEEPDYIRPIVLFQAQDKGQAVPVEVLKKHLMDAHNIGEHEIAVATGTQRELDGIALQAKDCPIRYIITVDALKEGWDCSFAYVLCTLQTLRSNQAVEQLLGRVLRMPYAKKRKSPALNRAYAHVVARSFSEAANALVDSLTQGMGFDAINAAAVLQPDAGDLFNGAPDGENPPQQPRVPAPHVVLELVMEVSAADAVNTLTATQPDVQVQSETESTVRVQIAGPVSDAQRDAIVLAAAKANRESLNRQIDQHNARLAAAQCPALRGVPFAPIPQLCLRVGVQGELELIERETLSELVAFDLLRADPRPTLPGFHLVQQSDLFEIYVEGERVRLKQADAAQLSLDGVPTDASENDVIRLLAAQIQDLYLGQTETQTYVGLVVRHLLREANHSLTGLLRSRFQLAQAIQARIASLRATAAKEGFQALLFNSLPTDQPVTLASGGAQLHFRFEAGRYPVRDVYILGGGSSRSTYHDEHCYRSSPEGEEFDCASGAGCREDRRQTLGAQPGASAAIRLLAAHCYRLLLS
jgi:type III restriction enzyme